MQFYPMLRSKVFSISLHVFGWMIFFMLPVLFLPRNIPFTDFLKARFSESSLIINSFLVISFYLNAYLLMPKFFFRKSYMLYFLAIGLLGFLYYYLVTQIQETPQVGPPEWVRQNNPLFKQQMSRGNSRQVGSFVMFILVWVFSSALTTTSRLVKAERRALEAEGDRKTAELSFLKAQINPHFLFNTLNNIYTLSLTKSEKTSDSIMRLSKIMRYVTSDVQKELVPLQQEIDCIKDYIDLQKLRLSHETVKLNFSIDGNADNKQIAPLILLPFVENVFKYGISNERKSIIAITLSVKENSIAFLSENTIFRRGSDTDSTGVGIENVKRRLNHIYPDKYSLDISGQNNIYIVKLKLPA
jgi:two-component system, LytTR family, sensor kinase